MLRSWLEYEITTKMAERFRDDIEAYFENTKGDDSIDPVIAKATLDGMRSMFYELVSDLDIWDRRHGRKPRFDRRSIP